MRPTLPPSTFFWSTRPVFFIYTYIWASLRSLQCSSHSLSVGTLERRTLLRDDGLQMQCHGWQRRHCRSVTVFIGGLSPDYVKYEGICGRKSGREPCWQKWRSISTVLMLRLEELAHVSGRPFLRTEDNLWHDSMERFDNLQGNFHFIARHPLYSTMSVYIYSEAKPFFTLSSHIIIS